MKKIVILTAIVVSVLFGACTSSETQFNKYGISFTCPADWKVTEAEQDEDLTYVSIEKKGKNSSGIVMIMLSTDSRIHSDLVATYCSNIEAYGFENITTEEMPETMYGGFLMSCTSYQATMQDLAIRGAIYSVVQNEQTIFVVTQEALDDIAANEAGFARIKETIMFFAE